MRGEECSDRCPCQDTKHPLHTPVAVGFDPGQDEDDDWFVVAYATDSGVRVLFEDDDEGRWDEE